MRHLFRCAVLILAAPIALCASAKPFSKTGDYEDSKVLKGYLNIKFDTYSQMYQEPRGTSCDWVFVDPAFKMDDLRGQAITVYPDSITRNGGFDYAYWGMFSGWYGNGIVASFEASLRTRGLNLQHPAFTATASNPGRTPGANPMLAYYNPGLAAQQAQQAQVGAGKASEPPALTPIQQQIELDRYNEDKAKLGLEEAVRRSEAREAKRKEDWQAQQTKTDVESTPKSPEEAPGWNLVVYMTESTVHAGAAWIPFVPVTNTTTGEFLLLHDGHPVLAGRHCSVGAFSASGPKCGNALATAFDAKKTN